jgi:predicted ABC-type ATPase
LNDLALAVERILLAQKALKRPLAVILAGHNGSGKSSMWKAILSDRLQMPLINADRMMLAILPEANKEEKLVPWAQHVRDHDTGWMNVAQKGVEAFVGHAMRERLPFAMETVFSHWIEHEDGRIESKIGLIRDLQAAGYFVLLLFVGLSNAEISISRVQTRVLRNGHDVPLQKLIERFPRTQKAIRHATHIADASILVDNSGTPRQAFTPCLVQLGSERLFDLRVSDLTAPNRILDWMNVVAPLHTDVAG